MLPVLRGVRAVRGRDVASQAPSRLVDDRGVGESPCVQARCADGVRPGSPSIASKTRQFIYLMPVVLSTDGVFQAEHEYLSPTHMRIKHLLNSLIVGSGVVA